MNYKKRFNRVYQWMAVNNYDVLLIDNPIDLYYLTGLSLSAGTILLCDNEALLWVDSRYLEICSKNSPIRVMHYSSTLLVDFLSLDSFRGSPCLAFDSAKTTYKSYMDLKKKIKEVKTATNKKNLIALKPVDSPLSSIRIIKDKKEIERLRTAADLTHKGLQYVIPLLKPGITEREIAVELEIFWKRHGGEGVAFDPIIAFGPNSSMPHYRAGESLLKKGDPVLLDIGVTLHHYHSDMTRVVFVDEPPPVMRKIYEVVEMAQKAALKLCRPGIRIGDLDQAARSVIDLAGYGEAFTHSLGHGVGLDIHEWPIVRNTPPYADICLQEGMVLTIEPGIYLKGIGGVRIEDTVLITKKGCDILTAKEKNDPKTSKSRK